MTMTKSPISVENFICSGLFSVGQSDHNSVADKELEVEWKPEAWL